MAFVGRKPTNAPLTADDIPNGIIGAADLASGISGLITWQSVQTTGFTAVAGRGYPCNTTSAAFTVTLPASPTAGDTIQLLDYAGTFDTNALTISPNGNKIEGGTANQILSGDREGVTLTYIDSTQGWLASSGIQEGTDSLSLVYSVDFLVIAGGGAGGGYGGWGGGGGAGGYRSSNATYGSSGGGASAESNITFRQGTVYTITVGAGGTGNTGTTGSNGVDSSISGTGLTTITSSGGGGGGFGTPSGSRNANSGGSGGGGGYYTPSTGTGGSGTANQGYAGANSADASPNGNSGGGGGAGEIGNTDGISHGGDGVASTITGSSVTRGGGGGGINNGTVTTGGTGGGGTGDSSGTDNTGGGGGGNNSSATNGGSGVVILRMPTANYSGTTTGSPTVTTDGSDKVIVFNSSGSITG